MHLLVKLTTNTRSPLSHLASDHNTIIGPYSSKYHWQMSYTQRNRKAIELMLLAISGSFYMNSFVASGADTCTCPHPLIQACMNSDTHTHTHTHMPALWTKAISGMCQPVHLVSTSVCAKFPQITLIKEMVVASYREQREDKHTFKLCIYFSSKQLSCIMGAGLS